MTAPADKDTPQSWADFFSGCHADASLDEGQRVGFSNSRVLYQYYGMALEAAGPFARKRCLDAGCGVGCLSLILAALGAKVSACDVVASTIESLQRQHPEIDWFVADVEKIPETESRGPFDLVLACEVLQYVGFAAAVSELWRQVAPGGRLIGIVPHAACPHVRRTQARFPGRYTGVQVGELAAISASLPGVEKWAWRGACFLADQTIVPYGLTSWSTTSASPSEPLPNRLQFVFIRKSG